jgi:hypothetical protein
MYAGNIDGYPRILVSLGQVGLALYDGAAGTQIWTWTPPLGSVIIRYQILESEQYLRLFVFPAFSTTGICFDFRGTLGRPRILWQNDYSSKYWLGYGPNLVLADMDNDGIPELIIASKPAYAGVLDIETGLVKFELKYEIQDPFGFGRPDGADIGRPYGLLHAADIDGDGYCDLIMIGTHVEEYIAVLHNEQGQALSTAWTMFVEKDFPEDHRNLVAQPTSLVDINGDGKLELVLGLFNIEGDQRWRTVAFDPLKGYEAQIAVIYDRYFWGCYDMTGNGLPDIIVSPAGTGRAGPSSTVEAYDGQDFSLLSALNNMQLSTRYTSISFMNRPLAANIQYYGALDMPLYLDDGDNSGLIVKHTDSDKQENIWQVRNRLNTLKALEAGPLQQELMLTVGRKCLSGRCMNAPLALSASKPTVLSAHNPLVCSRNGISELVLSLSDGTVIGCEINAWCPRQFITKWSIHGQMPAIWIDPQDDGYLLFTVDSLENIINVHHLDDSSNVPRVIKQIKPEMPINRNRMFVGVYPRGEGGIIPFGKDKWRLFVPLRLGENQLGCLLYNSSGELLWQDLEVGPMPRIAAISDIDSDGYEEIVVDNHGMQYIYDLSGDRRMIAHAWGDTIPNRGDGCAHAQPVIGNYGPDGSMRIIMTPGFSAIETLNAEGERIAVQPMEHYNKFSSRAAGIGRIKAPNSWAIGVVSAQGIFYCIDTETCQNRWTLDLESPRSIPIAVCVADIDGDGQDEFIVSLPDGRLLALTERNGNGIILWSIQFVAAVIDSIIADVDSDGLPEIIIETDDGYVRILKNVE